jgi:hydrogenase 3 maturation protease
MESGSGGRRRSPVVAPSSSLAGDLARELDGATGIVVVGIGQEMGTDDAVGLWVARKLERRLARHLTRGGVASLRCAVHVFLGGTAPENLTSTIRKIAPSHVLLIDAAELGERPGSARVIGLDAIGGVSFSTHMLPLPILGRYLAQHMGCHVVVVGIQPQDLNFGMTMSPVARKAATRVARELAGILPRA